LLRQWLFSAAVGDYAAWYGGDRLFHVDHTRAPQAYENERDDSGDGCADGERSLYLGSPLRFP
jgi:hypothetical protein